MCGHRSERGKALRMLAGGILGIAAGVAVKVEEEGELHRCTTTGACAMPGAIASVAAFHVRIDCLVAISRWIGMGDHSADFGQYRRCLAAAGSR